MRHFFLIVGNVFVYEPLRGKAQTIKDKKLRSKIPKNFPDEHRPSNGLYTVLPHVFYFSIGGGGTGISIRMYG